MKKFSSLIIALAACIAGFAQNARTVSGIVTESDGTPVVAAMVIEKGTMNGASTDIDGKYSIRVSDKDTDTGKYVGLNGITQACQAILYEHP